jgi:hypothetical protein
MDDMDGDMEDMEGDMDDDDDDNINSNPDLAMDELNDQVMN